MSLFAGDLVFHRNAKSNFIKKQSCIEIEAQGHFMSVLIGHVKKNRKTFPTTNEFWRLLGSIGLVGLDHVKEALGEDAYKKLIKYYMDKFPIEGDEELKPKKTRKKK